MAGPEGAPRLGRRRKKVWAAVAALAALAPAGAVLLVLKSGSRASPAPSALKTWDEAAAALGAGETDAGRRATARTLLEEATRLGGPHPDAVLRAVDHALETAPGSPELRWAHARARSRIENGAPVLDVDLEALARDADPSELETLSRDAIAAGTTGTHALETMRGLVKARPTSRALAGLLALTALQSGDPAARADAAAALDLAHPMAGRLRALHDALGVVDRAAELFASHAPSDASLEATGRALTLTASGLAHDAVLATTVPVVFSPLAPAARETARAVRLNHEVVKLERAILADVARTVLESRGAASPPLAGAFELVAKDPEALGELYALRERRAALAERVEPLDPVLSFALVENSATHIKQLYRDAGTRQVLLGVLAQIERTAARADEWARARPTDDLDVAWAFAAERACLSRAAGSYRRLAELEPGATGERYLEQALEDDCRAFHLGTARLQQFSLDVRTFASDFLMDLILLERTDGVEEVADALDQWSVLRGEVKRRYGHDPAGATAEVQGILATANVKDRSLAQPILALAAADLRRFDEARRHLAAVEQERGSEAWGPFRADRIRAYIEKAEQSK